mmetsp:Transcript_9333/g.23688  ORF Transcript_9333/g.23688 Transcript_9333/m.23688 type:complete len:267 (+) Transcript_9333:411-1211(+)
MAASLMEFRYRVRRSLPLHTELPLHHSTKSVGVMITAPARMRSSRPITATSNATFAVLVAARVLRDTAWPARELTATVVLPEGAFLRIKVPASRSVSMSLMARRKVPWSSAQALEAPSHSFSFSAACPALRSAARMVVVPISLAPESARMSKAWSTTLASTWAWSRVGSDDSKVDWMDVRAPSASATVPTTSPSSSTSVPSKAFRPSSVFLSKNSSSSSKLRRPPLLQRSKGGGLALALDRPLAALTPPKIALLSPVACRRSKSAV